MMSKTGQTIVSAGAMLKGPEHVVVLWPRHVREQQTTGICNAGSLVDTFGDPKLAPAGRGETMMRVGIASDHGGFALKGQVAESLRGSGYEVVDFGAHQMNPEDDYPDFIIPLARAVAAGEVDRGVALCGSGVGASIAANKIHGVRAGLIHDVFSAHQGVQDDDMNVFCLGGKVIGSALAWELIQTFLTARFSGALRHQRRLAKVQALENQEVGP